MLHHKQHDSCAVLPAYLTAQAMAFKGSSENAPLQAKRSCLLHEEEVWPQPHFLWNFCVLPLNIAPVNKDFGILSVWSISQRVPVPKQDVVVYDCY